MARGSPEMPACMWHESWFLALPVFLYTTGTVVHLHQYLRKNGTSCLIFMDDLFVLAVGSSGVFLLI